VLSESASVLSPTTNQAMPWWCPEIRLTTAVQKNQPSFTRRSGWRSHLLTPSEERNGSQAFIPVLYLQNQMAVALGRSGLPRRIGLRARTKVHHGLLSNEPSTRCPRGCQNGDDRSAMSDRLGPRFPLAVLREQCSLGRDIRLPTVTFSEGDRAAIGR